LRLVGNYLPLSKLFHMKQISSFSLLCLTIALILSNRTFAQQHSIAKTVATLELAEKFNGDDLIEKMIAEKRDFNKNRNATTMLALSKLPQAAYILNRNKPIVLTFDGLDYLIQHNEVVEIKGFQLSKEVLSQITEKLSFLDKTQYDYADKINCAYAYANADLQNLRNLDKWYLQSLKVFSTTVNDLATFVKKADAAQSLATNLAKMPQPNVGLLTAQQVPLSLVQLAK